MDKQHAREIVIYELGRLDLAKHKDMSVVEGKIHMTMNALTARGLVNKDWAAVLENTSEGEQVHVTWGAISITDTPYDFQVPLADLTRENSDALYVIATVTLC